MENKYEEHVMLLVSDISTSTDLRATVSALLRAFINGIACTTATSRSQAALTELVAAINDDIRVHCQDRWQSFQDFRDEECDDPECAVHNLANVTPQGNA